MPHSMVWLSTDEIIKKVPCTCVDGRTQGMKHSAAGGSFGLIVHLLAAYEKAHELKLNDEQITQFLIAVSKETPVYLHTDQHSLDLIYARLALDPNTKLRSLTPAQQRSFIETAILKDYQGCGHVKLLMTNTDAYQVPERLTTAVLKTFLQLFFADTANFLFDVLAGNHAEEKVFIIEQQTSVQTEQKTALYLEDKQEKNQFFCHRPMKRELLRLMNQQFTTVELQPFTEDTLMEIASLHDRHAEITLSQLAAHLSIENINI